MEHKNNRGRGSCNSRSNAQGAGLTEYRAGFGLDIHRLVQNRSLVLGGAKIPFELGLEGHSDGDVLLHAVADALLGAASMGDIGEHFPDTEPRYKGISSMLILKEVKLIITRERFSVYNVDCTVAVERPKISEYKLSIRENISSVLGIDKSRVSVKATTAEGLGFIGRGEGICAYAAAALFR